MLKLQLNVADLAKQFKEFAAEVEKELQDGVKTLAAATYSHIVEDVDNSLHSSKKKYKDALSKGAEEVSPGVWLITLDEKAFWIEEGIQAGKDMKEDLLKNGETYPSGKKYKVIPFEHTKPPQEQHQSAKVLVQQIRGALRRKDIPYKNIEYNRDGSPKLGKLHQLDLGGPVPGKGNTRALQGLSIYQSMQNGKVRRDIMTFRTVTDGPESSGKWLHPGFEPKKFLDKGHDWAEKTWEQEILPDILRKWQK
jgi:hypothetical protein